MEFNEDDYLMISGLQHYIFCRRQWALIHIEQQWLENFLTIDGEIMHENAHNPDFREKRKDTIILRGLRVSSPKLGLSGECDVVELHSFANGVIVNNLDGRWIPVPVEYKHGEEKNDYSDDVQLCAQVLCLEEMFGCEISKGYIYYGKTRHRKEVSITNELRELVVNASKDMHNLMQRGYTPKPVKKKQCQSCSIKDLCLPQMDKTGTVESYIRKDLGGD